ncbi:MAG: hypothetical protein ACE5H3_05165 [Planctomycetota bacterium]
MVPCTHVRDFDAVLQEGRLTVTASGVHPSLGYVVDIVPLGRGLPATRYEVRCSRPKGMVAMALDPFKVWHISHVGSAAPSGIIIRHGSGEITIPVRKAGEASPGEE